MSSPLLERPAGGLDGVTVVRCGSVWWLVEMGVFLFWAEGNECARPRGIYERYG